MALYRGHVRRHISPLLGRLKVDFDLWRNIVREYSEELLGTPEHDGTRSKPTDYDDWSLYRTFERCLADGTATAHVLGVGLDALTLAATILTVVVLDDDAFGDAFASVVRHNDEGEIVGIGADVADGVPFTAECVDRMLTSEPLASSGAACLSLAWQPHAPPSPRYSELMQRLAAPTVFEPSPPRTHRARRGVVRPGPCGGRGGGRGRRAGEPPGVPWRRWDALRRRPRAAEIAAFAVFGGVAR